MKTIEKGLIGRREKMTKKREYKGNMIIRGLNLKRKGEKGKSMSRIRKRWGNLKLTV